MRFTYKPSAPIKPQDDLIIKALHASVWGAAGFLYPYLNVYYREIGLSGTQIGLIGMLASLAAAFATIYWGMLNDRLGKTRLLYTIACAGTVALVLLLAQARAYVLIVLIAVSFNLFHRPSFTMADITTLKMLGDYKENYGVYRLWGTLGFILTSAVSGFVLEQTGLRGMFVAFPLAMVGFWLITQRLPNEPAPATTSNFGKGIQEMMAQPAFVLFTASVLLLWTGAMAGLNFVSVIAKDMGATERLVGLISTVAAIAEIPLLQYSNRVLRKFGPVRLLVIAMIAYILRLFLYAFMPSASWVLWLSLLQGISFCPFLIGSVAFIYEMAPDHLKSTSQGILGTITQLGSLSAALFGGWLYDHVDRFHMYILLGFISLAALFLFLGGLYYLRMKQRRAAPASGS